MSLGQHVLAREAALKAKVKELESGYAEHAEAAISKIEELADSPDPEAAHKEAAGVLSQFLRNVGQKGVADTWDTARGGWFYG